MHRNAICRLLSAATLISALTASLSPSLRAQDWFKAPLLFEGVTGVIRLAGDVDGDGDVDLLRFNGNTFTVMLNDGRSAFTDGATVNMPDGATCVVFADVDGDGDGDVIASTPTTNPLGAGLLIYHGAAGAGFAPPLHVALGGNVAGLAVGNVNGDGIADIAVSHYAPVTFASLMRWFPGNASRSYVPGPPLAVPNVQIVSELTVLDENNDGVDDIAFVDGISTGVLIRVLLTAAGVPTANGPVLTVPSGYSVELLAIDVDNDGDTDLVMENYIGIGTTTLTVWRNQGGGVWTQGPVQTLANTFIANLYGGDWDGDGNRDLVLREAGSGNGVFSIFANDGTGTFTLSFWFNVPSGPEYGEGCGVFDLNGDGHPDFVNSKSVFCGDGTLTGPFLPYSTGAQARDVEDDGDFDLLSYAGEMFVNDGRGVFTRVQLGWPGPPGPNEAFGGEIEVGDLDGNGLRDVLVPRFSVFLGRITGFLQMHRFEDNGIGSFVDRGPAAPAGQQIAGRVFAIDVDGDSDIDLVTAQGLWLNNGAQMFAPPALAFPGWLPAAMADVDGDGNQDFLAASQVGIGIAILRHTGPATFTVNVLSAPSGSTSGYGLDLAAFGDLDGDGDPDVFGRTTSFPNAVTIFVNQGGVFTATATTIVMPGGQSLAVDADMDGRMDLAVSDYPRLTIRRRNGTGFTYDPPVTFVAPQVTGFADLDQDGDPDGLGSGILSRHFDGALAGMRRQYGTSAAGTGGRKPVLGCQGPIRSGLVPVVRVREAVGGSFALLAVGTAEVNVPNAGLPGLTSYTQPIVATLGFVLSGAPGLAGAGRLDMPLAVPNGFTGTRLFLQAFVFDAGAVSNIASSNGLELLVGQ